MTDNNNDFIMPLINSLQVVLNKENATIEEIVRMNELTAQMNILSSRIDALDARKKTLELHDNDIKKRSIALEHRTDEGKSADGWLISDEIHKYFKDRDELLADCKKLDADRDALTATIKAFTDKMV